MEVVAFIGPSGTGKSYRAMYLARKKNINYIIDDGILIKGNKILAGLSAKKEKTVISSIRRAIFTDEMHRKIVKKALSREDVKSILILGTSLKMVKKIVEALELPNITEIINIDEVASSREIKHAQHIRKIQGKHVIPVPTFEIKKDFSGYFIDSLKLFDPRTKGKKKFIADKSIVRPTFSYLGDYYIHDFVIDTICRYEINKFNNVSKIHSISVYKNYSGITIKIQIIYKYGCLIHKESRKIQRKVKEVIEYLTSLNIISVDIYIRSLAK